MTLLKELGFEPQPPKERVGRRRKGRKFYIEILRALRILAVKKGFLQ